MTDSPENCGLEPELFAQICADNQKIPFYHYLGMKTTKLGEGFTNVVMESTNQLTNHIGTFHGGALLSLADAAMGMSIRTLGFRAVLLDMGGSFFLPIQRGDVVTAKAKIVHRGRRHFAGECELLNGNSELVVKVRGIYNAREQVMRSEDGLMWVQFTQATKE